jgi:hypothetical protein
LPDEPDALPYRGRIGCHIDSGDGGATGVEAGEGREDADSGALARAVRAEQAVDGARLHREGEAVERLGCAEALAKVGGGQ